MFLSIGLCVKCSKKKNPVSPVLIDVQFPLCPGTAFGRLGSLKGEEMGGGGGHEGVKSSRLCWSLGTMTVGCCSEGAVG